MKACAAAIVGLLAAGALALGACGGGGSAPSAPPVGETASLQPVSLAGISCG